MMPLGRKKELRRSLKTSGAQREETARSGDSNNLVEGGVQKKEEVPNVPMPEERDPLEIGAKRLTGIRGSLSYC